MAQNKQQAQSKNQKKTEVKEKPLKDVPIQLKWFTPEGIKTEIKRIRWIKFPELLESTGKVLLFCILFGMSSISFFESLRPTVFPSSFFPMKSLPPDAFA